MSVMRYGEKTRSDKPPEMRYSVECYFDRAIRWRPDDSIVRMMYSIYLAKAGRTPEAVRQLDIAADGAEGKENAFTQYNLGLNYLDLKEYDKALSHAQNAYSMGFLQPDLKNRLEKLGKWSEPKAVSPDTSASSTDVVK